MTMAVDMASSKESVNGDCDPRGFSHGRDSPPAYAAGFARGKGFFTVARQARATDSRASKARLTSSPQANPPRAPPVRSTRWHGTNSAGALTLIHI